MENYLPENFNKKAFGNYRVSEVKAAVDSGEILEAMVTKCDQDFNLEVAVGNNIRGILPLAEFEYREDGKPTKTVQIISRVGKTVQFKVKSWKKEKSGELVCQLSRKEAQQDCVQNYIKKLEVGQIISAKATHVEDFGVFCDIGCGYIALIPIKNVSVTKLVNPKSALANIGNLKVIVKSTDDNKITLTHKELLGNWEHEAAKFKAGETVVGTARAIEEYGIFVQLTPNLVGLSPIVEGIEVGDSVAAFIQGIYPDTMKVKLNIIGKAPKSNSRLHFDYVIPESGVLRDWVYSPANCSKVVESHF